MVQYWRQAGLTYLKYANYCARFLRRSLKEPHRSKAIQERDNAPFTVAEWKLGKAQRPGITFIKLFI